MSGNQIKVADSSCASKLIMVLKFEIHCMAIHFSGHTRDWLDFTVKVTEQLIETILFKEDIHDHMFCNWLVVWPSRKS